MLAVDVTQLVDFHVGLGNVITSTVGLLLTWTAHKILKKLTEFLEEHRQHGERLDDAEQMIDRHSRGLMKHGILGLRVQQLHRVRRKDDVQYINRDDEPMMS